MLLLRSKLVFIVIMMLILVALSFILWLRYDAELKQFSQLQQTLMQQQATQSSKDISKRVDYIRNQMSAISLDNSWFTDLSKFENLVTVQESMRDRLKLYFPTMYTYSIASDKGEQIGGDIEHFIGDACKADIKRVAGMFDPKNQYFDYEPYLHAKADAYHFDVMIPVFVQGKKLVFFMSFKPKILSKILKEHTISEHFSFLVRKDFPDLIEVTPEAVRNNLKRDFKLTQTELNHIAATAFVPHTLWKVVVVENWVVMNAFKHERMLDAAMLFIILFCFWSAVLWFGMHNQSRQTRLFSKLRYESQHDALTGSANRRKLFKEVGYAINDAQHLKVFSAILYMDLNDFKRINDVYGHDIGDLLLKAFAGRLNELTRQEDVVARMGGDEFVVLLNSLGSTKVAAEIALTDTLLRFRRRLNDEYSLDNIVLSCKPSIGSVLIDENSSPETLINEADKRMYKEKSEP